MTRSPEHIEQRKDCPHCGAQMEMTDAPSECIVVTVGRREIVVRTWEQESICLWCADSVDPSREIDAAYDAGVERGHELALAEAVRYE